MSPRAFPPEDRVCRERERREITGIPVSSWYVLQDAGLAPRPIPLSPKAVGWLHSELQAWVAAQKAKRDARLAVAPAQRKRERKTAPCP
jgi:prophage regulatory protein